MSPRLPAFLPALVAVLLIAACGEVVKVAAPSEVDKETVCVLDGMLLRDFPGPKGQIHYEQGPPDFFCDTKELFSIYLQPEQKKRVLAIYTQDMAKTDWASPQGYWIDAKAAFYVVGSRMQGSMGPTIASFAAEPDARAFAGRYGGKVLRFAEVTPEMVDLSGGVVQDKRM